MSAFSRNLRAALAGHRKTLLAHLKSRVRAYTADPSPENKLAVEQAARSLARYQAANEDELPPTGGRLLKWSSTAVKKFLEGGRP